MRVGIPILGGLALLAVALGLGLFAVAGGIRDRDRQDVISVTGSAKERIVSDFVVWDAAVTSQAETTAAASKQLASWTERTRDFLREAGAVDDELRVGPVATESVTNDVGTVVGYRLTRTFQVRSARVDEITELVERSAELLAEGIPIAAQSPQYVFTKLAQIRPRLLVEATRDAKRRAEVLIETTGDELGGLRDVNVGVFQITAPNSTDVSDYGVYDTSTIDKDVTAVVNVSFAVD